MLSHFKSESIAFNQENDFLPPISRWTTYGGMFILGVISLAVPVASVSKYKEVVKTEAVIRPAGELRIVQAATEGQIIRISVQENQPIKKGDVIATIDDSRLQTKKSQLQSNIQQAKLQLLQINSQIRALNNQIHAETDRINRTIASAEAELSGRVRSYQDKRMTTVAEAQEAEANVGISEEELHKAHAELRSAQANLNAAGSALIAARSKQNRYEMAAIAGALSKDQLEEAQLAASQQEQAVEAQKAVVEAQKQTITRLEQAVSASIARRQKAQVALNPSHSEVAIATERIAQEKAAGKASLATLDKERQALIAQRIEAQKQLDRDIRELQQLGMDIRQTIVTAPSDGTIFKLNLRNSSQTVRSGEEIAQIAPSNSKLVAKSAVSAGDVSKVKVGQQVHLRISACPHPDYGTLKGKVTAISPDAISPQAQGANPNSGTTASKMMTGGAFYEVSVEPENLVLSQGKSQCQISLGMQGRADIISREETVLQFFLRKAKLIADF
ncbi:HlyD family efflux transporter periplasmic adaptor subunit [Scytonema sp. UIC 10036]|uniref:HlyD family efflux transporter periplasmic adaptor subunit n=1 Tax=Scytonema sp. UIC 10036 TaxID=2304196 RepID=UPI0012DAB255|nr:HlyD family efflux transporter periplasmic adaptor subunit [Scytonema sp. UIC 10036]MUG93308.1 HlyD family efflux transporter periplasmic adaptor subunit [Scytonema sp. UIC 10036]